MACTQYGRRPRLVQVVRKGQRPQTRLLRERVKTMLLPFTSDRTSVANVPSGNRSLLGVKAGRVYFTPAALQTARTIDSDNDPATTGRNFNSSRVAASTVNSDPSAAT